MAGLKEKFRFNIDYENSVANLDALITLMLENDYKDILKMADGDLEETDKFKNLYNILNSIIINYERLRDERLDEDIALRNFDRVKIVRNVKEKCFRNSKFTSASAEDKARMMFSVIKRSALESQAEHKVESGAKNIHPEGNKLAINKTLLDELSDLLSSGDRRMRGSSLEYRQIQREIDDLKRFTNRNLTDVQLRYVKTMLKALAEKAEKYVAARKNAETDEKVTSYKGKRINIMRQVCEKLKMTVEDFGDVVDISKFEDEQKRQYKSLINKKFNNMTFNSVLYEDVYVLNNPYFDSNNYCPEMVSLEADALGKKYYGKFFDISQMKAMQKKRYGIYRKMAEIFDDTSISEARGFIKDLKLIGSKEYMKNPSLYKEKLRCVDVYPELSALQAANITGVPEIDKRIVKTCEYAAKYAHDDLKTERKYDGDYELVGCSLGMMYEFEKDAFEGVDVNIDNIKAEKKQQALEAEF